MRAITSLASVVGPLAATVSWILSTASHDGVDVGRKVQLRHGMVSLTTTIALNTYKKPYLLIFYRSQLAGSPLDQRAGYHTPATTEQDFSSLVTSRDAGFDTSIDSLPNSVDLSSLRSQNADSSGHKSQQLSPNEMIAPVSAVHSMSVNLLGSDNVSTIIYTKCILAADQRGLDIFGFIDER